MDFWTAKIVKIFLKLECCLVSQLEFLPEQVRTSSPESPSSFFVSNCLGAAHVVTRVVRQKCWNLKNEIILRKVFFDRTLYFKQLISIMNRVVLAVYPFREVRPKINFHLLLRWNAFQFYYRSKNIATTLDIKLHQIKNFIFIIIYLIFITFIWVTHNP